MKKIAVVGLYSIKNVGDNILCDTARFLLKKNLPGVEIVEVDVNPRESFHTGIHKIMYKISKKMNIWAGRLFPYEDGSRIRYLYEKILWWIRVNYLFRAKLKKVDAIVFAGGGFLKFRTQGLNYYVEQIIKIASKNNIPVMMNGVGIEGYDERDIRCQKLKAAINKDCVKIITTRDDIDTLRNHYIVNPNIKTERVGDPALWVRECYDVEPDEPGQVIGINIIRGKIFQAYGNELQEARLYVFYRKLIQGIEQRGWNWILFSNGMKADVVFGNQLLKTMHYSGREKMMPAMSDPRDYLKAIQKFKCVFGARLHACITSYALDVPVVGLIWSEKLQIFSEVIGKPQNFFSEEDLNVERILDAMEASFTDTYNDEIRSKLRHLTDQYVKEFIEQIQ